MRGGDPAVADAAGGVTRLPVIRPAARRFSWSRVARLGRFGLVGMSGFVVNEVALAVFVSTLGVNYLVGAVLATQLSSLWNFGLVELWAFRHHEARRPTHHRLGLFLAVNNVALILRGPILFALTSWLGVNYLVSNLVSLGMLTVVRFAIADSWIWGPASVAAIDEQSSVADELARHPGGSTPVEPPPAAEPHAPAEPQTSVVIPAVRSGRICDVAPTPPPEPSVPPRAPTRFVRVQPAAARRRRRTPVSEPAAPVGDDVA